MFGIGKFFNNIQNSFGREVVLRTVIKEAVKKIASIDIDITDIECKTPVIKLKKLDSAALSIIFIKKAAILKEINSRQTQRTFNDLR